ncbi:unnamed protein product [Musa hybrid cultivar]
MLSERPQWFGASCSELVFSYPSFETARRRRRVSSSVHYPPSIWCLDSCMPCSRCRPLRCRGRAGRRHLLRHCIRLPALLPCSRGEGTAPYSPGSN